MKIQTIVMALIYGLVTLILLPLFFIWLNLQLSLPIYSFLLFKLAGVIVILGGAVLWFHSIALFYLSGKGTPVPTEPPKKLVLKGAYKYTRNPMYIGVLLILLGYFFLFGHLLLLANLNIIGIFFHIFITRYEEPTLKKRFGKIYTDYYKKTPRWLEKFPK